MFFCSGLFVMYLGYFQECRKTMMAGAAIVAVSILVGMPDVMQMIGFDGDAIENAMNQDND